MNKVDVIKKLAEDKTFENETSQKGENDLEVKIKILNKEIDTLKAIINLKEIELTSKDDIIKKLKKEAEDMLLYP
jgi:chaperonin GroEL (HSP60 family)